MADRLSASVPVFGPALKPAGSGFSPAGHHLASRNNPLPIAFVCLARPPFCHCPGRALLPARAVLPRMHARGFFCGRERPRLFLFNFVKSQQSS